MIALSEHFLKNSLLTEGARPKRLSPAAEQALLAYDWPGNVRELKNVISRVSVISRESLVTDLELNESIGVPYVSNNPITPPLGNIGVLGREHPERAWTKFAAA